MVGRGFSLCLQFCNARDVHSLDSCVRKRGRSRQQEPQSERAHVEEDQVNVDVRENTRRMRNRKAWCGRDANERKVSIFEKASPAVGKQPECWSDLRRLVVSRLSTRSHWTVIYLVVVRSGNCGQELKPEPPPLCL